MLVLFPLVKMSLTCTIDSFCSYILKILYFNTALIKAAKIHSPIPTNNHFVGL